MCVVNNKISIVVSLILGVFAISTGCKESSSSSSSSKFLKFTNGQAAQFVIGQPDFETTLTGSTRSGLRTPYGNMAIHNNKIYVSDENSRVLTFALPITANGPSALNVFGQTDFTSSVASSDADQFAYPGSQSISDGKLFVAEYENYRVVIFNSIPTTNGAPADVVVGQTGFISSPQSTCDAATFASDLKGVSAAGGKLVVTDTSHHRVMIYNTIPTVSGASADLVLGQADFTSCDANAGGTIDANTLRSPDMVWTDGARLIISDSSNNRVLIWNSFPTANGQTADIVLGQSDFETSASGVSSTEMDGPTAVISNGTQIFVADSSNSRVLIWNSFPTTNGQAADIVLGQLDFDSSSQGSSATELDYPYGLATDSNHLYIADYDNSRILVYKSK